MNTTGRVLAWLALILLSPIVVVLLAVGWVHDGWATPDLQCVSGPMPELGGPYYEQTETSGAVSWFPLGVDCTYDVPGDAYGPQTVHNYKVGPTIILAACILGIAAGVWTIARTTPPAERWW